MLLLAGCRDITIQERDTRGIMPGLGQLHAGGRAHELVRHGHEDAGTVTGVLLGTDRTAMIEVHQHFDGVIDDLAFGTLVQRGDHADTAGIMFLGRVIHAFRAMNRQI